MGVEGRRTKREAEMCFGMPSHWGGIVLGIFIVVVGVLLLYQQLAHVSYDIGALVLVFIGIAVQVGGLYRYSRR